MRTLLILKLGIFVIGTLALTSASTLAQTTAPGPYYATPSWDQQLPASTRFIVLSNWKDVDFPSGGAAVLDRETGLVWERSPNTTARPWGGPDVPLFDSAGFHCNNKNVGGRKGWRLPTVQELASLVDQAVAPPGPVLPAGHPFSNVQSAYWSATTVDNDTRTAWFVFFSTGGVFSAFKRPFNFDVFVWCVRGGQGVDPQ